MGIIPGAGEVPGNNLPPSSSPEINPQQLNARQLGIELTPLPTFNPEQNLETKNTQQDSILSTEIVENGPQSFPYQTTTSLEQDLIFASDNLTETLWKIEQYRNSEFQRYLGVTANLASQSVATNQMQEILRKMELETRQRYGIIYILIRNEQLELILLPPNGSPLRYSIPNGKRETILPIAIDFRLQVTTLRLRNTTTYLPSAQQLYH